MTRSRLIAAALALMLTPPVHAAESWGLPDEQAATFDGRVVDVQCILTGDCPLDCGAGRRQLGLLTKDDRLILAMKNATPFAGAVRDLLPYCGKTITVDGLFAASQGSRVFALQRLKEPGGVWISAERFAADWAKANGYPPDSPAVADWYRHDPTIRDLIAADGKLGLGQPE